MVNMRMLIRIVFIIFIANGIDCFGSDICCNFPKDENISKEGNITKDENITKDKNIIKNENITAESLVNTDWYNAKKNNLVLMIFEKEDDNCIFTSEGNEDKISFKLDENNNLKITYQNETKDKLNLGNGKYALFEIKTKKGKIVYLYCSDVESSENVNGIFEGTTHVSISVIACDTKNVCNCV